MRTENLLYTLVSVGYAVAQTSFITTQDASGHTLVITEIQSTIGVSGPTETIQILDIGAGITLTETIIVSPTHIESVEDINLPNQKEHMKLDCNIDPNGLGHCTEVVSAVQGASTIQTVITFETQFAPPPPTGTPIASSGSQAANKPPAPTSSSAVANSQPSSANTPAATPPSSSSVGGPSTPSNSTSSGATPAGTDPSTPTGLTTLNSPTAATPTATGTDNSAKTVTSPSILPTNGTLNPPNTDAASMGGVNAGLLVFMSLLGLAFGMI